MKAPSRSTTIALYAIAALLLANLVAILAKDTTPTLLPVAFAQQQGQNRQAPIAGGAGLFVMPAQLSGNTWGCYLMDVDRGTLCVYQFLPGARQLQFVASRSFAQDTRLANFNTTPTPTEIQDLVNKQDQATRTGAAAPGAEQPTDNNP
jgi:hypothetical protein